MTLSYLNEFVGLHLKREKFGALCEFVLSQVEFKIFTFENLASGMHLYEILKVIKLYNRTY